MMHSSEFMMKNTKVVTDTVMDMEQRKKSMDMGTVMEVEKRKNMATDMDMVIKRIHKKNQEMDKICRTIMPQ